MDAQTAGSLLTFAETTAPLFRGSEGKAAFEQFEQRYEDLLTAMRWFTDQGHANEGLRLATSLVPFWMASKRAKWEIFPS